jgi:uridylate kinase
MSENFFVISLGGSLIVPESGKINYCFLKKFLKIIETELKKGSKFIIVAGGGKTARDYISGANKVINLENNESDNLGIICTRLNANLLKILLKDKAYKKIIEDPRKLIKTNKIILAGGFKPGQSTDAVAVQLAVTHGVKKVINLSNIDYIYDKDPKFEGAKKLKKLSWDELLKITGDKWIPGKNTPFDPVASKMAKKNKIEGIFISGKNLKNLENCFEDKIFSGSIVK